MEINLGQIVKSKAGRDVGKFFIIIDIVDNNYVIIADGKLRKVERPKRKKIKHLEFTDKVVETIKKKLTDNLKITNAEIRKLLGAQDIVR